MTKPNLSALAYALLDLVPVFLVLLISVVGILFLQLLQTFISDSKNARCILFGLNKSLHKLAVVFFGPPLGVFQLERGQDQEHDEDLGTKVVYINQKKVPSWLVSVLGSYVAMFVLFALTVFWDIFLLRESHDCDDTTIDCFLDENATAITDCDLYEGIETNGTITCYTFTYSFGAGLAAVGGLITMIKIIMKILQVGFLEAYEKSYDKKCGCCSCSFLGVLVTQYILVLLVPFALPITLSVIIAKFSNLSEANIIQVVLIILTLMIGFAFPWGYFAYQQQNQYELESGDDEDGGHENGSDRQQINPDTKNRYGAAQN